jgi:hypothetical protein
MNKKIISGFKNWLSTYKKSFTAFLFLMKDKLFCNGKTRNYDPILFLLQKKSSFIQGAFYN